MRAGIVIGVDQVGGGLPRLAAAASGARQVAEWLERNDYHVRLFTDENTPVGRSDIFKAVQELVEAGNMERLVIYFAGHGFLKGPVDEYWLLSGAPADAAEAVNLTLSQAMARYKGIPQIIFISDACRVVPRTGVHSGIVGASIFPNTRPKADSAEIDFYYATHPGDPALERGDTEAESAHGLFTRELLGAHMGAPPEALLSVAGRDYVRNRWLKQILRDRVDLRAQTISLALTQKPDVQLQIMDGYIAQNETDDAATPAVPREADGSTAATDASFKSVLTDTQPDTSVGAIVGTSTREDPAFQERLGTVREAGAAMAGETYMTKSASWSNTFQSLTCQGDTIQDISPAPGVRLIPSTPGGSASRIYFDVDGPASQIAIRFKDGTGMLLPVLREYACEIVRHDGRTISLAYTWSVYRDPQLAELRAEVLTAATLGLLNASDETLRRLAARVRRSKRSDPILGVVAALAYASAGDFRGARSVRDYMRNDLGIDLFDSWLLAGAEDGPPVWPALPLLGRTWSFMEAFDTAVPEDLKRLPRVPGFWTVFEAEGMPEVFQIAQNGSQRGVLDNG